MFTYDREDRLYKLFWHDSLGYYPPSPASGGWTGKTLILVRGSLRGNARHVYEVVDDNTYTMKIQFSPDAEGWADVLTGVVSAHPLDPFTDHFAKATSIMSILIDKNTKVICQGFTGKNGTFHSEAGDRLRHQDGRRHLAGQRRLDASRPAGVRHRRRGAREDRRRRVA